LEQIILPHKYDGDKRTYTLNMLI